MNSLIPLEPLPPTPVLADDEPYAFPACSGCDKRCKAGLGTGCPRNVYREEWKRLRLPYTHCEFCGAAIQGIYHDPTECRDRLFMIVTHLSHKEKNA